MRIPQNENFSTRCQISHRPVFRTGRPLFYLCDICGTLFTLHAPYSGYGKPQKITCCDHVLHPLQVNHDKELWEDHRIEFTVFGGFEKNAINIRIGGGIHPMEEDHRIKWVYVRGAQGEQFKYLPLRAFAKVNVAFADEDAYAYCDRPICRMGREHCHFQCKRGLEIYAYCTRHGLFRLEL